LPEGEETWSAVASSSLVLLVEDEAQAVELLRLQLEGAGFGVAIARDGATGLDLARRLRPAAIVLDILLPKLDGWELLAQLKATGGESGLRLARQEQPALVILDLMMPEVDGFAVVERLQAEPATSQIPVVVLSAKSMSAEDKTRLTARVSHLARKGEFKRAE